MLISQGLEESTASVGMDTDMGWGERAPRESWGAVWKGQHCHLYQPCPLVQEAGDVQGGGGNPA